LQIRNCGRGIHRNEIAGVDRLRSLPSSWYAFTNLDLSLGAGTVREVDVILITACRVLVIDLKNWGTGAISGVDGRWLLDGVDQGPSPVSKISEVKRQLYVLLKREFESRPETRKLKLPRIDGVVALTDRNERSGITAVERASVFTVDDLMKVLTSSKADFDTFGPVSADILAKPLTEPFWKERLTRFFNGGNNSPLNPGRRKFDRYVPEELSVFEHPKSIYREFDAKEEGTPPNLGTLRLWDFAKVDDTRFQNADARAEITGRERRVFHWLRDRSDNVEQFLLPPRVDDISGGVDYWEVYDRRRRLKRLSDWSITEKNETTPSTRIELCRQLLSAVAELHRVNAAHLDLGSHSIWMEAPTTVRLSHLFAARHPSVESLGDSRYNFLASVTLPEDVLVILSTPAQRDVYLLGVAVHQILFGSTPQGEPAEWNPSVDVESTFLAIHDWLAEALDLDPGRRFANAGTALELFNRATIEHPTPQEVRTGLERFRNDVRSQMGLFGRFPSDGELIKESDRVDAWRSVQDGRPVIVKLWKQASWGDIEKEGKRILSFLERAVDLKTDAPAGLPKVRAVYWLSDAFALVQDWVSGDSLTSILVDAPAEWRDAEFLLAKVQNLESEVSRLHESGLAHGDLKPDNIVVGEDGRFAIIDFLDFSSDADGDRQNGAYSAGGDRFQRDRFAVLKISEEVLSLGELPPAIAQGVAKAISICRTKEPRLATLTPLAEALTMALEVLRSPPVDQQQLGRTISLSIRNADVGPIDPDEGLYFVRTLGLNQSGPATVLIRGSSEEIEVKLDEDGKPRRATRRKISPTKIGIVSRYERYSFAGTVSVNQSAHNDLGGISELLSDADVKARLLAGHIAPVETEEQEEIVAVLPEEEAEEVLTEQLAEEHDSGKDRALDVPLLWRELITIEKELTTDARVLSDSSYDKATRRHRVSIELESGNFDFDKNDTVGVQKQTKGLWRRIGELDLSQSTPSLAVIEPQQFNSPSHGPLVEEGQRIRLVSHFETESLKRRAGAVDRVLAGLGRAGNLVSVFDPNSGAGPTREEHVVDENQLAAYELNDDQANAFRSLISTRPLGLLQGPPGTGKTRFIAALAHYAITKGLAKNVLLSSQAHEAVNTAAEALLKLFRQSGGDPSILRIANNEAQVSDAIRTFHTPKVEQSIKDRFSATFEDKMVIAAKAIGLGRDVVVDVVAYDQLLVPMARRIAQLSTTGDSDDQRILSLKKTLAQLLERYELPGSLADAADSANVDFADEALHCLMQKYSAGAVSAEKINRMIMITRVGRDFVSSASRFQRSFEPFLAGTRQIVAGTCVGLGRTSLGLTSTSFDLVIVDEAARCTASELLVPLQAARWAVLVGDQAQLEPQHKAEVVERVAVRTGIAKRDIKVSDFERVFDSDYGSKAGVRLATQYRMLEPIGRVVSEAFYPSLKLKAGRVDGVLPEGALPERYSLPLTWIDTSSMGNASLETRAGETGRQNKVEADAIVQTLDEWFKHEAFNDWILKQTDFPIPIGVICMYAAQRDLIRKNILRSAIAGHLDREIKVGTVDSYQGKENPIVFLSLVRNNIPEVASSKTARAMREGFLATPNRINVAASRAMDRLIVVGSRDRWRHNGPMAEFRNKFGEALARGNASVIDAGVFLQAGKVGRSAKNG